MNMYIVAKEMAKIRAWTAMAEGEVGGFGEATVENNEVHVSRVFLIQQEAGAAHVDYSPEAVAGMIAKWGDRAEHVRFQWHSHADMEAFFSPTDTDNIETLNNGAWLASLVVNRAGKYKARIDAYRPFRVTINATILEQHDISARDRATWEKEYKENVKKPSYSAVRTGAGQDIEDWCWNCKDYHKHGTPCHQPEEYRDVFCDWCDGEHPISEECYTVICDNCSKTIERGEKQWRNRMDHYYFCEKCKKPGEQYGQLTLVR